MIRVRVDVGVSRPAKFPGISGSLQKWRVISRSPGIAKETPGIEGKIILPQEILTFVVFVRNVCLYSQISLNVG